MLELGSPRKPAELRRRKRCPQAESGRRAKMSGGCGDAQCAARQHRCLPHLCSGHATLVGWPGCEERIGLGGTGGPAPGLGVGLRQRWAVTGSQVGDRHPQSPSLGWADSSAWWNPGKCSEKFAHPVQGAPCLIGAGRAQNSTRERQGSILPAAKASSLSGLCSVVLFGAGKDLQTEPTASQQAHLAPAELISSFLGPPACSA